MLACPGCQRDQPGEAGREPGQQCSGSLLARTVMMLGLSLQWCSHQPQQQWWCCGEKCDLYTWFHSDIIVTVLVCYSIYCGLCPNSSVRFEVFSLFFSPEPEV